MRDLIQEIHVFISDIFKEAGKGTGVIGISGGVDSAVVASIASKALGVGNIIGVSMPCNSSEDSRTDAAALATHLGIRLHVVELDDTHNIMNSLLPFNLSKIENGNIAARLRMTTVFSFASHHDALVIGTGNRSEHMLGYFTKYGDGGTDLEPIGDLYKSEVYKLAEELDIPQSIIDKPASAGLWDGQTDEGELGYTYDSIELILKNFYNAKGTDPEIVGASLELIQTIRKRVWSQQHKTQVPPTFLVGRTPEGDIE